jgi:hypothetical protein
LLDSHCRTVIAGQSLPDKVPDNECSPPHGCLAGPTLTDGKALKKSCNRRCRNGDLQEIRAAKWREIVQQRTKGIACR